MSSSRLGRRRLVPAIALSLLAAPLTLAVTAESAQAAPVDITVIATNDFHGRINADGAQAGAAVLSSYVKGVRADNPNTAFVAAGDLIGASTFESFVQQDKPTIDALNDAGLDVSAAGNHEFDKGYDDLVNRVMAPYDATTNPYGGASWDYIAANVRKKADDSHALAPTWTQTLGGVKVGYVGAVTEHLAELVTPGGISDIKVTDIVTEVNAAAADLTAAGADVVIMLVHEGAAGTDCATMDDDPTSDFGSIVTGVDDDVDAIVSGHTHLAYDCTIGGRPVVSAGQYGTNVNRLDMTVDTATDEITFDNSLVSLTTSAVVDGTTVYTPIATPDPSTQAIVDAANDEADVLGAEPLGKIGGAFSRAKLANGTTENRGGESTAGNLVAEVQQWATQSADTGGAQIAFMNPGGLRDDLLGTGTAYPKTLTYKQAAVVQPFANTLVNMKLTGAQVKSVLEEQWQPAGSSRPFLKLGLSEGLTYTYDPAATQGNRITGIWLDGDPVGASTSYSVTVNSFLSTGGDNFTTLNSGSNKRDTGKTDLESMVDYLGEFGATESVDPSFAQQAVGVSFPADAPSAYASGDTVAFDVSSLMMTGNGDPTDSTLTVSLGDAELGDFPVTNTAQAALPGYDEAGTASVSVTLPDSLPDGPAELTLTGATTGTETVVPLEVAKPTAGLTATIKPADVTVNNDSTLVDVTATGTPTPTGDVSVLDGSKVVGTGTLSGGEATITAGPFASTGRRTLTVRYDGNATYAGSSTTVALRVAKQEPLLRLKAPSRVKRGNKATAKAVLTALNQKVTGKVVFKVGKKVRVVPIKRGRVAQVKLGPFGKLGKTKITARYLGDSRNSSASDAVKVRVVRR